MENGTGGVSNNDAATLALFAGGYGGGIGVGGRSGGLYYGNETLAADAHANGTAVKEAINCNDKRSNDGLTRISEQNKEQACNDREQRTSDRISDMEFRNGDRLRDLERTMVQNAKDAAQCCCDTKAAIAEAAKEAAKCCCDAKLQASENHSEVLAAIAAQTAASITRELDAANSRITQLETINALAAQNNSHHGGH